ncbi:hypothetical protein [Borrelia miyamotoi]|uniref:hypothetical protein n=1 Tax=Borrelia miyamotoi TaxID=47466 RepID=UPI001F073AF2|nr:hypothetical protein [Borrelia miyamotoi]
MSLCIGFVQILEKKIYEIYLLKFEVDVNLKFLSFSYGKKEKSVITFSIATDVHILIFDESTNGLGVLLQGVFLGRHFK